MSDALEEIVNQLDNVKEKLTDNEYKIIMDTLLHCKKQQIKSVDTYSHLLKDYVTITKQFVRLFIEREGCSCMCDCIHH